MTRRSTLLYLLLFAAGWIAWQSGALAQDQAAKFALPSYTTNKFPNGVTLLLMERHQLPLASFGWRVRAGGSICDPAGREGLASLTAQLLRKGTRHRSARQISEELDFVGGSLETRASHDYASGSAEFLSKDLDFGVGLIADLLQNPVFPEDELSKLIQQEVDGIAEEKEVPNEVLARYSQAFLFGAHPYARPVSGTEISLPKITREQVQKFHREQYVPDQLILAIVGDFKAHEVERKVASALGAWPAGRGSAPVLRDPEPPRGRRVLAVEKPDATQTFFRVSSLGVGRTNPDWVPLEVVNTLFGGRFTSMINSALRIESGLTYGARSGFSANPVPGEFYIGSFTKNETTAQALDMTLEVMKRLQEKGITAEQLQSAKKYLKGQFGPTLETNDQLANAIAGLEFFGLGADYYNSYFDRVEGVTLDDARRLIKKYYPLENLSITLIGQGAVIGPVASRLAAEVHKKSVTDPGF